MKRLGVAGNFSLINQRLLVVVNKLNRIFDRDDMSFSSVLIV